MYSQGVFQRLENFKERSIFLNLLQISCFLPYISDICLKGKDDQSPSNSQRCSSKILTTTSGTHVNLNCEKHM